MCNVNFRHFCEEWRIWIRPLLIVTYAVFLIIVLPLLIVNTVKDGFSRKDQLILIGGLFVLSAVPVSIWHIIQHVIHFTKPILQKHIIRILWMVPIYALNAWIGLWFPKHSIYVDSLRECYEAYVIYNFMVYLLNYLNLGMDLEATMEYKPQVNHFFPLCCLRPWTMGREFIHNCKHGILQYTVVRPITTFISVICELSGVYGEGTFAGNVAFPYIIVINNISQFVAMYCLVLFYRANKEDLKPMKPIPKFLCIKAVVFFSFFQGVLLNILVYYGYIKDIFGATPGDDTNLAAMLQNFLICIEMFIAAVAHIYSFPHYPFHINSPQYWSNPNHNWCRAFLSMMDISDMQEDVTEHLGVVSSSISRRFQGRSSYQPLSRGPRRSSSESEYLISKRQDGVSASNSQVLNVVSGGTAGGPVDFNSTGKRYNKNKNSNASTIRSQSNVARYGATDKLVLPVYDDAITSSSQSHFQSQLASAAATGAVAAAGIGGVAGASTTVSLRPSTSRSNNVVIVDHHKDNEFVDVDDDAVLRTNFGGISIHNRDQNTREYSPHYGAPGGIADGNNFLQARNVASHHNAHLIPESGDDISSFLGSGR